MVFILLDLSSLYETLINDLQNNLAFPLNNPMNQSFYFIIIIKVSEVFFHSKWIWLLISVCYSTFPFFTKKSHLTLVWKSAVEVTSIKKLILEIKHKCPLLRMGGKNLITERVENLFREPIGSLNERKLFNSISSHFRSRSKKSANFLSNNWYYYFG